MIIRYIVCLVAATLLVSACKKKEEPQPQKQETEKEGNTGGDTLVYGNGMFHFHVKIGPDDEVESYGQGIPQFAERKIEISKARIYLSDIQLVAMDGKITSFADTVLLTEVGEIMYDVMKIPVGKYKAIRFKVGLNEVERRADPVNAFGGALNKSDMWFGAQADPEEYVYANFQGKIDTATVPDENNARVPFSYKIGGSHLIQVAMPDVPAGNEFNIQQRSAEYLHLYMDVSALFSGIKLSDISQLSVNNLTDNNSELANKIAGNIANMFRYEKSE